MRTTNFSIVGIPDGKTREILDLLGERFPYLAWAGSSDRPLSTPLCDISYDHLSALFVRVSTWKLTYTTSPSYLNADYEPLGYYNVLGWLRRYNDD